jgi:hypothetical protein
MTDQNKAASEKSPVEAAVEHAVETFVYAPIGLLFEGASILPQLVEKGRNQVTMAKMIGKFAVDQGRSEATKAAGKLQDQAAGVLDFIGGSITVPPPTPPAPAPAAKGPATRRPARPTTSTGAARQAARKVAGVVADTVNAAAGLAIPDYDGLSASHVVNRLAGLSPVELEAVRLYEAANRGRKTILSKVAQLQSS